MSNRLVRSSAGLLSVAVSTLMLSASDAQARPWPSIPTRGAPSTCAASPLPGLGIRTPPDPIATPRRPVAAAVLVAAGAKDDDDVARAGQRPGTEATADHTVAVRPLGDDTLELVARWQALLVRQTVARDGRTTLELRAGKQRTFIVVTPDRVEVSGARRRISFDPRRATDEEYEQVQQLLARAAPMRLFRRYRARLEADPDENSTALGLLAASAYVGLLDGDVGAPARVAARLARTHGARQRHASLAPGCFLAYERDVYDAWVDLEACYFSTSVLYHTMCEFRWLLWVESSWFSFLSCSWGF